MQMTDKQCERLSSDIDTSVFNFSRQLKHEQEINIDDDITPHMSRRDVSIVTNYFDSLRLSSFMKSQQNLPTYDMGTNIL
ncbi:CLUMA_CG015651, isoform A [Clunio marinus]|uniref:CLUMA_CG015651, isoform A n=1 Tax=Clunio marinus TaxID=568069 RepID=A0A1J1IPM6_9DIPT|nr:CLUMA_CG015651, isoform A [Clunio marinus]